MNNKRIQQFKVLKLNELVCIRGGSTNEQRCYWEIPWRISRVDDYKNYWQYPAIAPIKRCLK